MSGFLFSEWMESIGLGKFKTKSKEKGWGHSSSEKIARYSDEELITWSKDVGMGEGHLKKLMTAVDALRKAEAAAKVAKPRASSVVTRKDSASMDVEDDSKSMKPLKMSKSGSFVYDSDDPSSPRKALKLKKSGSKSDSGEGGIADMESVFSPKKSPAAEETKLREEKEGLQKKRKSKHFRRESAFKAFDAELEEKRKVTLTRVMTSKQKNDLALEKQKAGFCSFSITGPFYYQSVVKFQCLSCATPQNPGVTVCESCAEVCHADHSLKILGDGYGFCDCGTNSLQVNCKCLPKQQATRNFLTEKEVLCLRLVFEVIDTDGNGFISVEELAETIEKVNPSLSPELIVKEMEAIDSERLGFMSFEEFCSFIFVPFQATEFVYFVKSALDCADAVLEVVSTYQKTSLSKVTKENFSYAVDAYLAINDTEEEPEEDGKELEENADLVHLLFLNDFFPKWLFVHLSKRMVGSLPEDWLKNDYDEISTLFYKTAKKIAQNYSSLRTEEFDIAALRLAIIECILIHNSMKLRKGVKEQLSLRLALEDYFALDDVEWFSSAAKCESTCLHSSLVLNYRFSMKGTRLRVFYQVSGDKCLSTATFISESKFKLFLDKTSKGRLEALAISYLTCTPTNLNCIVEYDLGKYTLDVLRKRSFSAMFFPPKPFEPVSVFDYKPENAKLDKDPIHDPAFSVVKTQDGTSLSGKVINSGIDLASSHVEPVLCSIL